MSLLDDVSIVVTPNGYKAGELYAVIPVPTEGAELVTCGDFSCAVPLDSWSTDTGWTISGNNATCDGTNAAAIKQTISTLTIGKTYRIIFDIVDYTSGTVTAYLPFGTANLGSYSEGTHTITTTITSTPQFNVYFKSNLFIGSIDNVSVKEYTSADMDVTRATAATRVDENGLVNYAEVLGGDLVINGDFATDTDWSKASGWSISGGTANANTTAYRTLAQNIPIILGKKYKVVYDVVSYTSGGVSMTIGANSGILRNAVGTYTEIIEYNNFYSSSGVRSGGVGFVGSVDNISVKEVTRDNVPRIDYTGGGCPHILAEPQRTNLVTYSSDFSQWSLSNSTLTSDYSDSIFGGKKSYLMTSTASPSAIYTAISSTNNTQTFFVKKGNHNYIQILNFGSSQFYGNFDIDSGIVGSKGTLTDSSTIEDLGNGWYKISCYFVGSITSTRLYFSESLTAAYGGGTTSSGLTVELAGCQSEVGSYATSYIPTNGEAGGVTRNQDIFTRDGIGSLINSTEGVLFAEIAALSDDSTDKRITLGDGTSSNRIIIGYNAQDKIQIFFAGTSGSFTPDYVIDITQYAKIAVSWSSTKAKFYVNGSPVLETLGDFSFAADTLTELLFDNGTGSFSFFGKVKQLQVYDTALTDTQLAALTS